MNADLWPAWIGGVFLVGLALAWQILRARRQDTAERTAAAVQLAVERADLLARVEDLEEYAKELKAAKLRDRVDGLDEDLSEFGGRVNRLERWREQRERS